MNTTLTIVARIEAKADSVDKVQTALLKLIEPTRQEQGCLQYELHQDNENPQVFIFYENWDSRQLWQSHMNNDHLKAYMAETDDLVSSFILNEMNKVD
jgi:quinol monooxygenase YgiN